MSDGDLDDFKARLPLADIVGRHVRLVRHGRELTGLCPFHSEKTPSFTVAEDKGFYHCFGCQAHGNAIDFVMAIEGVEFIEAVNRLAEQTGIPAPSRRSADQAGPDRGLFRANEAASRWFSGRLAAAGGGEARQYLDGRGVASALSERFSLGLAPAGRDGLKRALMGEGFEEDILVEAGLLIRPEGGGATYDRFRERLMFPIQDERGRVVGFGGRALGQAKAKYLNTPDTPLFHKRRLLYGLPQARKAARDNKGLIVAEGYMDVIALAGAGLEQAVAPLGTAVSEEQLQLMWKLADEPTICLDGDTAGLRAAQRLAERALPLLAPGKTLRFSMLPSGEDPDSLLRSRGRQVLVRHVEQAVPLIDFVWEREKVGVSLSMPEHRAALQHRMLAHVDGIADRTLKRMFKDVVYQRMRGLGEAERRSFRRGAPPAAMAAGRQGVGAARLAEGVRKQDHAHEARLLAPLLLDPEILPDIEEELAMLEFADSRLDALRQEILAWYADVVGLEPEALRSYLIRTGFGELVERLRGDHPVGLDPDGEFVSWSMLDIWRVMADRHRKSAARRMEALNVEQALLDHRDGDAEAQRQSLDSLLNPDEESEVPGTWQTVG